MRSRPRPEFPETDKLVEAVELYEAGRAWIHESRRGEQGSSHMERQSAKLRRAVVTCGNLKSADSVVHWLLTEPKGIEPTGHASASELWALDAAFREFEDAIFKRAGVLLKEAARNRIADAKKQVAVLQKVVGEIEANLPQDPKDP